MESGLREEAKPAAAKLICAGESQVPGVSSIRPGAWIQNDGTIGDYMGRVVLTRPFTHQEGLI